MMVIPMLLLAMFSGLFLYGLYVICKDIHENSDFYEMIDNREVWDNEKIKEWYDSL